MQLGLPHLDSLEPRTLLSDPYGQPQFLAHDETIGNQSNPVVAMSADGTFVVAWDGYGQGGADSDIFARRFNALGQPLGNVFQVNTTIAGVQFAPSISMNDSGAFVIAWQDRNDDTADVYVRSFAPDGTPLRDDLIVNTLTSGEQMMPSVSMDEQGGFVVVWAGSRPAAPHDIAARRFGTDGLPLADEFWIVESEFTQDLGPQVDHGDDGRFVVTWGSWSVSGAEDGIYSRVFDVPGAGTGPVIHVDPRAPDGYFFVPAADPIDVAVADDGEFVVAWCKGGVSGTATIFARRFAPDQTDLGASFVVGFGEYSRSVSAAMDDHRNFTVVWETLEPMGLPNHIVAQQFDKENLPIHAFPIGVDHPTQDGNYIPVIAMNGAGDFVVVWQGGSGFAGPDRTDVYVRRFVVDDSVAPVVLDSRFEFETQQQVVIRFSEDVYRSLGPDDLTIRNVTAGHTLASDQYAVQYDFATNELKVTFWQVPLPDADYRLTLTGAGITDEAGNALASDEVVDFFVLAGDADRDRDVDLDDFNILASNFNAPGKTFSQGNFSYDTAGNVNLDDFNLLAARFGTGLSLSKSTRTATGSGSKPSRTLATVREDVLA